MIGLGIDLGTANTVVCHPRAGVLLDEPSVIAFQVDRRSPRLVAVGTAAREMVGRAPAGTASLRPLHDGVITDLELARRFLAAVVEATPLRAWQRLRVRAVIGVPGDVTPLEQRGLEEAADAAGLRGPRLLPESVAAVLGCGLEPLDPSTRLVIDVGGGTSEITALSHGGVIARRSCRTAGDEMTLAVQQYLRQEHQLIVGEAVAEQAKVTASAGDEPSFLVSGQDAGSGRPRMMTLDVDEVGEAVQPVLDTIVRTLTACLDDLPPSSLTDVLRDGALAVGGGSLLHGFGKRMEQALGVAVRPAEEPLTCVATGLAFCLYRPDLQDAFAGA